MPWELTAEPFDSRRHKLPDPQYNAVIAQGKWLGATQEDLSIPQYLEFVRLLAEAQNFPALIIEECPKPESD